MELAWWLTGVLIGMLLMWVSCYFNWKKSLERDRNYWKSLAGAWQSNARKWRTNCDDATKQTTEALDLNDRLLDELQRLKAAKLLDDQVVWRCGDYARRMEGDERWN